MWQSAVCGGPSIMRAGVFYAEFMIIQKEFTAPAVGVVAADFIASGAAGATASGASQAMYWIDDSPEVLASGWNMDPVVLRPFGFVSTQRNPHRNLISGRGMPSDRLLVFTSTFTGEPRAIRGR